MMSQQPRSKRIRGACFCIVFELFGATAKSCRVVVCISLRPWLIRCVCGAVLSVLLARHAVGNESADLSTLKAAVGEIFGADHLVEPISICQRAQAMPPRQRFEFLRRHVLPEGSNDQLRILTDFAPTVVTPLTVSCFRDLEVISPAIELVLCAGETGQLELLEEILKQLSRSDDRSRLARLSMLTLTRIAKKDFPSALQSATELKTLVEGVNDVIAHRDAVALVAWAGLRHPVLRQLSRELSFVLHEEAANRFSHGSEGRLPAEIKPRDEVWLRQVTALKNRLQPAITDGDTEELENARWISSSQRTMKSNGMGFPDAAWKIHNGRADHVVGHHHDHLFFLSPLTGNFSIEADVTSQYQSIQTGIGDLWAGNEFQLGLCETGRARGERRTVRIVPVLAIQRTSNRIRLVVENGIRTTFINGRRAFMSPHPPGSDPWFFLHSVWYGGGTVKNLRITGDPHIPETVELANTVDLAGWTAYHRAATDRPVNGWRLLEYKDVLGSNGFKGEPAVLVGRRAVEMAGTRSENLLCYHRPMAEDGTIEFEFRCRPGVATIHPAIGSVCFLLERAGVKIHHVTDGQFDRAGTDPVNTTLPRLAKGVDAMPWITKNWNHLALTLKGDDLTIAVNGVHVFHHRLKSGTPRHFGLFHFADDGFARARNIRWTGKWPRRLSEPSQQQLADDRLEQLLGDELPLVFQHDFADGIPKELFQNPLPADTWQQRENGIRLSSSTNGRVLQPVLTVEQDFDITVSFADFRPWVSPELTGSGLRLSVVNEVGPHKQCTVVRTRGCRADGTAKIHVVRAFKIEDHQDVGPRNDHVATVTEESDAGRLRLSRRGSTIHYLYAEQDSKEFRLLASESFTDQPITKGNVHLVLQAQRIGEASVTWKDITIRAAKASGSATVPFPTIAELDAQREKLTVIDKAVFTGAHGPEPFLLNGDSGSIEPTADGLKFIVPGADSSLSYGLLNPNGFSGDFDVTLEVLPIKMEAGVPGQESRTYLRIGVLDEFDTVLDMKYVRRENLNLTASATIGQRKRFQQTGRRTYRSDSTRDVTTAHLLRIARRGDVAYLIFQESKDKPMAIQSRFLIGNHPIRSRMVQAMTHTGGADRETQIVFKRLIIRAEQKIGRKTIPAQTDAGSSLPKVLKEAFE